MDYCRQRLRYESASLKPVRLGESPEGKCGTAPQRVSGPLLLFRTNWSGFEDIMPTKKRKTIPTNGNTIERFLKKTEVRENAGANREEVGEEGVPGGGVTGGGVRGGGVPGGGVTGGGVTGGGVPGGRVRGGGSEENTDATQEETAGGEVRVSLIHDVMD
ncbi:unnamed protein product [Boreogadus saida]